MKLSAGTRLRLEELTLPAHGALDYAELEHLGLPPEDVLDFSSNINPYGPPPAVQEALRATPVEQYPDREVLALRRALSTHLNVSVEQILVGNGSAELLWLVGIACLRSADRVLVLAPTFGEYAHVSELMGAEVHRYIARPDTQFVVNIQSVGDLLAERFYRLVFVCNPNNPTGQVVMQGDLRTWIEAHPETLFVVDEAYVPFASRMDSALKIQGENVLVLRSMTKDYALAGLRLGYAIGSPDMIRALRLAKPPWSVNALAQVAGLAALEDESYLKKTITAVMEHKTALVAGLQAAGMEPVPSQTHFFLLPVGNASKFRSRLLQHGIQVRDCTSFGLPAFVRLSARLPEDNKRLLNVLEEEFG